MHMITAVILLGLISIASATTTADYCAKKLCGNSKHIACGNSGSWSSSCPSDRQLVDINDSLKNVLVRAHNEKRNIIAGGGVSKLKPACRMATIKWSDELAKLAELNVRQCAMSHDACHNTDTYKYSGQNLAWIGWFNPLNAAKLLEQSVQMWYDEVAYVQQSHIDAYPSNYNGPAIGHFTVMVSDRNIEVGCAASTYSVKGQSYKAFLLACNYATTNILGAKMYASCSQGASGCKTGTNPSFTNLCSTRESYTPNVF